MGHRLKSTSYSAVLVVPEFGQVTVTVKINKHYEAPHTWIIKTNMSSPAAQIGSIEALAFAKDKMRGEFHGIMDIHSDETQHFATSIFTALGNIRPELLTNPIQRGSGVWGQELNEGTLLLIEAIRISPQYRRKGLGRWLLNHTLKIPEISANCKFAFAWPTVLNVDGDCTPAERPDRCAQILQFFHAVGFRRVGRTSFLGYAINDPSHPSRVLPIALDPPLLEVEREPTPEELAARYPLHTALASNPDSELVPLIKATSATSLHALDFAGNTPLHIAATFGKLEAVNLLLALGGAQDLTATNREGLNPLQMLQAELRSTREFFDAMIGESGIAWRGYEPEKCKIILKLSAAMGKPVPNVQPPKEPWTAFQWGCTCGQCQGGWLSPRMKYSIHFHAEVSSDDVVLDNFPPKTVIDKDSLSMVPMCNYIPSEIRKTGIYPSYLQGYSRVFGAIAHLTATSSTTLLSKATTLAELSNSQWQESKYVEYYLSKGGTIEHALLGVIHRVWEAGPAGDNSSEEIFGEDLRKLPECANDNAYLLVCTRLGLPTQNFAQAGYESDEFDQEFADDDFDDYFRDGSDEELEDDDDEEDDDEDEDDDDDEDEY